MVIEPGHNNRINTQANNAGKSPVAPQPASNPPAPSAPVAKPPTDSVSLSAKGQAVSKLEAKISSLPDVDMDKVQKAKDAISSGQYAIDSAALADKMIAQDDL